MSRRFLVTARKKFEFRVNIRPYITKKMEVEIAIQER
jgi:hypothetical protein